MQPIITTIADVQAQRLADRADDATAAGGIICAACFLAAMTLIILLWAHGAFAPALWAGDTL